MRSSNVLLSIAVLAVLAPLCALQAQPADLILTGAHVWTGDPEQPRAEAVAVAEDRILAVGSVEEVLALKGPGGTALRAYTVNNAWAANEEGLKGSITPGKLADLVVLDRDPFAVEPDALKDLEVRMTIVGGEVVWKDGEYRGLGPIPMPTELP